MKLAGTHTQTPRISSRDRLVDAFVESYVEWREGCEDVESAYHRWTASASADRDLAFLAYQAALDREEKAAHVHELRAEQLDRETDPRAAPAQARL
jgi:hypothetical protein